MTLSLWRYSHLILALVSSLFLIVASVSGIILAIEPISQSVKGYDVVSLDDVTLAETITVLQATYDEVLSLEITSDDYVIASLVGVDGQSSAAYINPKTGEIIGSVIEKAPIFKWATSLHRSLFLKGIGRFFVGFVSLLLFFIAVSGVFLLAQRQGGFHRWFSQIKERDFNMRYHVILSRWLLVPIVIIAGTGVFLSAEKFNILPESETSLDWNAAIENNETQTAITELPFFQNLKLSEIRKVTFPFSEFPEDYYEMSLRNRDVLVHQYTGAVVSEVLHPFTQIASQWSLQWHTGSGSIIWSTILLLACGSILFFIFSGTAMFLKRRRKIAHKLETIDKDEAEFIILVGSESGNTYAFAKAFTKSLQEIGKLAYLATLNEYTTYQKAKYLVLFTATYGDGDAPTNARNFEKRFKKIKQPNDLRFSVLGFGESIYPDFCKYAIEVDALLQQAKGFLPLMPLTKIDEQSKEEIAIWVQSWSGQVGVPVHVSGTKKSKKPSLQSSFKVIASSEINEDDTFLIRLRSRRKIKFQSGDLLNIIPPGENLMRQYSIASLDGEILLSIKKHKLGKCSNFLRELKVGDTLKASVVQNSSFHFPKKAPSVICIANGTGIAPFLGMVHEQKEQTQIAMFWGGRTQHSFDIYRPVFGAFKEIKLALSRTERAMYVQNLIALEAIHITTSLESGGVIMICGSLVMQREVLDVLEGITMMHLETPLAHFESNGQILTDCY